MNAEYLKREFDAAKPYGDYLATGTDEQRRRWTVVYDAAHLTESQSELINGFERELNVLVVSGIWCGDCVQQCPLLERIVEANPAKVRLRLCDRDEHRELADQVRLNGGDRVPVALFLSEDYELCGLYGDRTINRYRALARKQLGASCPTGIGGPDPDELASTLGDWLIEFERIQLMLRLSPRLRQRHGD
jgi:thiol-disulfide isomerase/thioredoxin